MCLRVSPLGHAPRSHHPKGNRWPLETKAMTLPTAAEVDQKAKCLVILAQELERLAPGLEILSPGFREVLQDMAETLVGESHHLNELSQWMGLRVRCPENLVAPLQ